MTVTKRYTAVLKIVEVETDRESSRSISIADKITTVDREIANFVVRDEDLDALKAKLVKHVDLV